MNARSLQTYNSAEISGANLNKEHIEEEERYSFGYVKNMPKPPQLCNVISQLLLVDGQYYVESPCPQLFEYKSDNRGSYGAIRLQLSGPVTSIVLRTNFTIAARLPSNYVGSIELIGNELSSLQNFKRGAAINYRVNFPVSSPLPRLTGLSETYRPARPEVVENRPRPQPQPGFDITYVPNIGSDRDGIVVYEYPQPPIRQPDKINRNPPKPPPSVQTVYQAPDDYLNDRPQFNRIPAVVQENPVNDGRLYTLEIFRTSRKPVLLSTEQPYEECGLSSENVPLIYQGNSYQRGEWPWLVAIYKRRTNSLSYICSGTLVSNQHVITAAHCMHGKATITSKRDIVVKVGVFNLEDWGDDDITVTRKLSFATVHESYNASNLANDILVMTLDRTVRFNENIKPACLWTGNPDLNQIVGKTGVNEEQTCNLDEYIVFTDAAQYLNWIKDAMSKKPSRFQSNQIFNLTYGIYLFVYYLYFIRPNRIINILCKNYLFIDNEKVFTEKGINPFHLSLSNYASHKI
ncbi:unnamed protein product [Leptidea sinapis]|uniref:Peptidase S1 domain-containing protein n=1 Tax=Leptidea sinapis TaxID=189913 RepID=A0A5E4QDE1_9NEOP|nr:unnamed protein product [Leptidea sinapis]